MKSGPFFFNSPGRTGYDVANSLMERTVIHLERPRGDAAMAFPPGLMTGEKNVVSKIRTGGVPGYVAAYPGRPWKVYP